MKIACVGLSVIFGVAASMSQPAAAATATFDFVSMADGGLFYSTEDPFTPRTGFEGNWNTADGLDASIPAVVGNGAGIIDKPSGIILYAQGSNSSGAPADAFFDSSSYGPRPAGLGVCSSTSCKTGIPGANTGDDNLNRNEEQLVLTFNSVVQISELTINDATHTPANGTFLVGGNTHSVVNGVVDPALLATIMPASTYTLKYIPGGPQLYIGDVTVAAVPLPATVTLLVGAFGFLGWRAREGSAPRRVT